MSYFYHMLGSGVKNVPMSREQLPICQCTSECGRMTFCYSCGGIDGSSAGTPVEKFARAPVLVDRCNLCFHNISTIRHIYKHIPYGRYIPKNEYDSKRRTGSYQHKTVIPFGQPRFSFFMHAMMAHEKSAPC